MLKYLVGCYDPRHPDNTTFGEPFLIVHVAQLVEPATVNRVVPGSSPGASAKPSRTRCLPTRSRKHVGPFECTVLRSNALDGKGSASPAISARLGSSG